MEQSEEGPSVSVQGRVNDGGLGPGGADVGPRRLKDGGRKAAVLGHVLPEGWVSIRTECEE